MIETQPGFQTYVEAVQEQKLYKSKTVKIVCIKITT